MDRAEGALPNPDVVYPALDRPAAGLSLDDLRRLYDDLAMGAETGA